MSGIEGSGIVNPLDAGPDTSVKLIEAASPREVMAVAPVQTRNAREEQGSRDRRAARPSPERRKPDAAAGHPGEVSKGIQVLVALDEAVVLSVESEAPPKIASGTRQYAQHVNDWLAATSGQTAKRALSLEA